MKPRRPTNIPAYAEACLQALVASGLNDKISLRGAFGLLHYLDYRATHDVDAWWDASASATWIDVPLDSFPDLVAGKMVALIERGAPRDFRDIFALCNAGLTTPKECWNVWRKRQELAESDSDTRRAQLAIETHLARIALHRPLDTVPDLDQREEAEQVRAWFRGEFLDAVVD